MLLSLLSRTIYLPWPKPVHHSPRTSVLCPSDAGILLTATATGELGCCVCRKSSRASQNALQPREWQCCLRFWPILGVFWVFKKILLRTSQGSHRFWRLCSCTSALPTFPLFCWVHSGPSGVRFSWHLACVPGGGGSQKDSLCGWIFARSWCSGSCLLRWAQHSLRRPDIFTSEFNVFVHSVTIIMDHDTFSDTYACRVTLTLPLKRPANRV